MGLSTGLFVMRLRVYGGWAVGVLIGAASAAAPQEYKVSLEDLAALYKRTPATIDALAASLRTLATAVSTTLPLGTIQLPPNTPPPTTPPLTQLVDNLSSFLANITADINDPAFWTTPSLYQPYGYQGPLSTERDRWYTNRMTGAIKEYDTMLHGIFDWSARAPIIFYRPFNRYPLPTDTPLWPLAERAGYELITAGIALDNPVAVLRYILGVRASPINGALVAQVNELYVLQSGYQGITNGIKEQLPDDSVAQYTVEKMYKETIKWIGKPSEVQTQLDGERGDYGPCMVTRDLARGIVALEKELDGWRADRGITLYDTAFGIPIYDTSIKIP
ncbi:hypothetical protein Dda_2025 [Drechslerella dactyloides]|uniref:Uncharacterized protein n=1 Tax=Drechslerella dactyloides TaxID=74499 RepID=A0AAD6J6Y9_DREDA|nr:hypothetical protein Dda_2025 [Drechslerella dactyloides]